MISNDESLERIMKELGYVSTWLSYGFVDADFLREQAARYQTGDDPNPEHYRWAAFLRVIEAYSTFDDTTLVRYVELASVDPDRVMADSALIRLIRSRRLTDAQEAWLRGHPVASKPVIKRAFGRGERRGRGSATKRERVDRPLKSSTGAPEPGHTLGRQPEQGGQQFGPGP